MDTLNPSPPASGLRRWHCRIASIGLLAVLCFAATGLLHPLMTRMQPKPAATLPPPAPLLPASLPAPAAALQAARVDTVQSLRLLSAQGRWWWRAETDGDDRVRHLDAETGAQAADDFEREQAIALARHFARQAQAAVRGAELIRGFGGDYPYVNRLLPVWRVEFATPEHLTAFVSTREQRLATLTDDRKRLFQRVFAATHSWQWLAWPWRGLWVQLLLAGLLATVVIGMALRFKSPAGRRFNLRRAHRLAAPALGIAAAAWVLSGFVQLQGARSREQAMAEQRPLHVATSALQAPLAPPAGSRSAALVSLDGKPAWRWSTPPATTTGRGLAMGEHQHAGHAPAGVTVAQAPYVDAASGEPVPEGEARHVVELFAHFGLRHATPTRLDRFTPEYGFLFKRLPVWRAQQDDASHTTLFVDADTETLAARMDDRDRLTAALFAYAHKWEWLTPLAGKDARDLLTSVVAASLLAVAFAGAALGWRQRRNTLSRRQSDDPQPQP